MPPRDSWGSLERLLLRADIDLSDEDSVDRFVQDLRRMRQALVDIDRAEHNKKVTRTMIVAGLTASLASILGAIVTGLLPKISDVMTKLSRWFGI